MERNPIPAEIELLIDQKREDDRKVYGTIFSSKWVEVAFTWVLYAIGVLIIAGLVRAALPFLPK